MSLLPAQELAFRRCAADEEFFIENFWYIKHPEHGRILMKLRDAQRETLQIWREERYSVALKARQIGFSTLAGAHAVWLCLFQPDRYIVMLSRGEREAISLLKKSKYGLKFLPLWMLERAEATVIDNNQTTISFTNESIIQSLPSGSDPARGESVYGVFVDEWAFLPDPEDAWASIEPITDIGGRVWGISTANGANNFFHRLYNGAKQKINQFRAIFYPWSAVDERGEDWYAIKAANMESWALHQEYPRDDVECFIKSGNPVFDVDDLAHHDLGLDFERGTLRGDTLTKTVLFEEQGNGSLRVWRHPVRDGRSYAIGADVAEGLEHGDYSAAHVIDHKTGEIVAVWHGRIPPDQFGTDVLQWLGWYYGCAIIGVEVNNQGLTTAVALQNARYPNLYYRHTYDERTDKRTKKVGWRTQVNTKPLAINELARDLRGVTEVDEFGNRSKGSALSLHDEGTYGELVTFVYDANGKTHGSPHDDRTMSLAIANQMRKHTVNVTYGSERARFKTFDWYANEIGATEAPERFVVGAHGARSR